MAETINENFALDKEEERYLFLWSRWINGARQLLLRLKDDGVLLFQPDRSMSKSDCKVYSDAVYRHLLHDMRAMNHFLLNDAEGRFRNHKRDKRGKLVSVEHYFVVSRTIYQEV